MARRFIVSENDITKIENDIIQITGSEVKHIQVLRHNIGDEIIVNEYVCNIEKIIRDTITLKILSEAKKIGEPSMDVTLYMAILKGEKMELVVQKAVELGVKNIVPFYSQNVIVKLDEKTEQKRKIKFQTIANEACKQCGRTDIVNVNDFIKLTDVMDKLKDYDLNIFAYENEKEMLKKVLKERKNVNKVSCIVGPEGGFDDKEANKLKEISNVKCVSLGERILRAETAAINIISNIMYEFEN